MTRALRPLLFFILIFGIPSAVCYLLPRKANFDPKPIQSLRERRPDIVFLSDSMVDNGIDPQLLGQLLGGKKIELLWYGGSESASWYFRFKNYIVASGIHPSLVCVVFRDQLLTDPEFRTTSTFRYKLEAAMHPDEPVYRLVLGSKSKETSRIESLVNSLYPLNARRHAHYELLSLMVIRGLANFGPGVDKIERSLNQTFAISNLRANSSQEAAAVSAEKTRGFDPDPRTSFLPHLVDLARAENIPLCFIRVRRYPSEDGIVPQSPRLREYVSHLSDWLKRNGCAFIDETDDLRRTPNMYLHPGDDHMGPWAKRRSTELYAEELRALLPP